MLFDSCEFPPFFSFGKSSVMNMELTQLAPTMVTVICSWTGLMSTTMKPLVR